MASTKASDRTALLIYCTREEASKIKLAAQRERRTISGFVMNAVMTRFAVEGRLHERKELILGHDRDTVLRQARAEQAQVESARRSEFPK